jgi:TolB-like protein/tetratricopeptide (TPR) repeat protein
MFKSQLWRTMQLFEELKRRNVFRVGAAYAMVAWLLLQLADLVLDNISAPAWVIQAIMLVLAIGFPLALLFAWAFELTPGGLKRDAEVDRSQSIATQTGKRLDRLIIVFLVLIVAGLVVERIWFADEVEDTGDGAAMATVTDKSIAVLPFVDLSEAQNQGWFAKGLADEILNALMRTPDLLVASRTSAFKYIDSNLDIREIAAELGVAHVVEGSIRRSGDSVRVTAQLIRASDGFHLWSQNYDREVSDVIAIQEDLAVSIARALETSMDPAALQAMMTAGTHSVEAYQHYLNGLALNYEYSETSDVDNLLAAYDAFEKARTLDPSFANAHWEAARFWGGQLQLTTRGSNATDFPMSEILQRFEERISAAIDSTSDQVMRWQYESDRAAVHLEFRKQMRLLQRVLEARPNYAQGWMSLMQLAVYMSDFEAASDAADSLMAIYAEQPDPDVANSIIITLHRIGRAQDGAEFARQALSDFPGNIGVIYQAHRALLWAGDIEAAAALLPSLVDDSADSYAIARTRQACAEGRKSDAERITAEYVSSAEYRESDTSDWHLYMLLGRVADANDVIRRTSSPDVLWSRASWLFYRQFDPAPFPEILALLEREKINRPPALPIPFACQ